MKRWRFLGGCIWIVENDFSQWTDYSGQRLAQYLLGKFKNKLTSWIHMDWTEWDFAWVKGYLPPVEGLDCHWFSDECELWHVVFEWWVLVLQAVQFARLILCKHKIYCAWLVAVIWHYCIDSLMWKSCSDQCFAVVDLAWDRQQRQYRWVWNKSEYASWNWVSNTRHWPMWQGLCHGLGWSIAWMWTRLGLVSWFAIVSVFDLKG